MKNKEILNNLLAFVDVVKENEQLAQICYKAKSIESLVMMKKLRSFEINFVAVYCEILEFIEQTDMPNKFVILDVCCGLGFFTQLISYIYPNVKGNDINRLFIEFANQNSKGKTSNSISYYEHDINMDLISENYNMIISIFGINAAKDPPKVVKNFINHNAGYIVLFDGNSDYILNLVQNKCFNKKTKGIEFANVKSVLLNNNYEIIVEKNVHTLPSFLIDNKYLGYYFAKLSKYLRRYNSLGASKLIIAKKRMS